MKQCIISFTAALASGLMAVQVCSAAVPTSYDGTDIVARGEAVPPPLFGSSDQPQEEDLVDARAYMSRKPEKIDLSIYSKMLFAFRKCSIDWVESWFPDEEELKKLTDSNPLAVNDTYFLRYSQDDQKRHPVAVSPGWINDNARFARQSDPTASGPWWPWAALQGASGDRALALSIIDAVLSISGEELVFTNLTNKDDYWPIFQKSDSTPILVWWKKPMPQSLASGIFQWYILMSTEGSTPEDGSVSLGSLSLRGFEQEEPTRFSLMKEDVNAVYHLKDLQSFGGRKGEIQL